MNKKLEKRKIVHYLDKMLRSRRVGSRLLEGIGVHGGIGVACRRIFFLSIKGFCPAFTITMLLMANSTKQILGLPAYKIKHTMVLTRAANKEHM